MADSPENDLSDGAYHDPQAVDPAAGSQDQDVASAERKQDAEDRISAAGVRDAAADARDLTALERDQASAARSRAMSARDLRSDHAAAQPMSSGEIVLRAGQERLRDARDRGRGADYRSLADKDQQAAALDREHAAQDRLLAGADRAAFARLLAIMDGAARKGARSGDAGVTEQDIVPREATPAELRRANRYFELSRDLMVTASLDGYFKSVNPALRHILGWSAEQFMARPLIDWVHPDDHASTLAQIQKLAQGEVAFSFVNRYEASDGGYRWLDWTAILASGERLIYASARDVTERERAKAALAASEKRTRQILESAHDAFVATDDRDVIIDWNAQAQVAFGWTREEALGRDLADTIFPESYRDQHRRRLQRLLAGDENELAGVRELCALRRDGREFPIEFTMTARQTDTGFAFNVFLRDISERRAAEEELKRSRELSERLLLAQSAVSRVFAEAQSSDQAMRGLVAALGGAMGWQLGAWWSRVEDSDVLRCQSVWHAQTVATEFEAITLGLTLARGQALPGRVWASGKPAWTPDLASDPSFPRMQLAADAGLHASVCVPVVVDGAFRAAIEYFSAQTGTPDQPTRQILSAIADQMGALMSVLDERAALVEKLERLALSDELTGLANRRAWQQGLEHEIARARRNGEPLCVAMIDLDDFKRFNDAYGHQAGDGLLRDLSVAWRAQLRGSDILARYGGEEFTLAFHAQPLQAAATVLERLRAAVPQGQTCSAGLAAFDGAESADELVGRADAALYDAKLQGRDRVVIASGGADSPSSRSA